jgi:hypothetical protein
MKNVYFILVALALTGLSIVANATKKIVDLNGHGDYTTITAAISAATIGDTIKVWPGTYSEQVVLNKNIVLQGSGYENTIINGQYSPMVNITAGKMMWFCISSLTGNGVQIVGTATITNCVVKYCMTNGICGGTGANVYNCIILNCNYYGVYSYTGTLNVINCISRNNISAGFYNSGGAMYRYYCNGSTSGTITGNQGCVDTDPLFTSVTNSDYHINSSSPCWNLGMPTLNDPDGTISDMGYFGGSDCPIMPVVYSITGTPNGNNTDIQAKARANY